MARAIVVTNQCPRCMSTFADVRTAKDHVQRSEEQGRCRVDKRKYMLDPMEPDTLICHICGHEAPDMTRLQKHLTTHSLRPPSELHGLAIDEGANEEDAAVGAGRQGRQRQEGGRRGRPELADEHAEWCRRTAGAICDQRGQHKGKGKGKGRRGRGVAGEQGPRAGRDALAAELLASERLRSIVHLLPHHQGGPPSASGRAGCMGRPTWQQWRKKGRTMGVAPPSCTWRSRRYRG
mmetsp:Transcript_69847/g.197924  ORF Transcript_69847/g.197924 Transcript_69847/m.197924 type:complete len:235 (+) Transcript_69847:109-813(+)